MDYIIKRGNQYHFNRWVPKACQDIDKREVVRISLNTDSRKEALRLARKQNQLLEAHWESLRDKGQTNHLADFEKVAQIAQLIGLAYMPSQEIANLPIPNILARLAQADKRSHHPMEVNALLGGQSLPQIRLSDILPKFFEYTKGTLWNKSEYQVRKWKNPRVLAMKTFIEVIGNKNACTLVKDDMIKYRDWWLQRIQDQDAHPKTANKNIINVKTILDTVNDNMRLGIDIDHLFRKITFKFDGEKVRSAFETNYILSTLLNPKNLAGLNEEARWALYAIAETGAGVSEQAGLLPDDIKLECDIPHIIIRPRKNNALKTKYRKREIPLVGFALDAFKACPNGFITYLDSPENLSGTLGKYLRENELLPSNKHSVYSLRHSFQNRLLAVNAPDRVQADLMGHKFNRPLYGDGASLEQKLQWMDKIKLKA